MQIITRIRGRGQETELEQFAVTHDVPTPGEHLETLRLPSGMVTRELALRHYEELLKHLHVPSEAELAESRNGSTRTSGASATQADEADAS